MSALLRYVRSLLVSPPKPEPGCCLARMQMYTTPARAERKAS